MKKEMSLVPFLWILAVVILLAACVYFGWQVNRQQKRLDILTATVNDNTNKISGIVNFINTSLSSAQKTQ